MEIAVRNYFLEGTLTSVGFGMLGTREPAEEVGRFVIECIGDEMVADAHLAGGGVCRSRTIEGERHEDMAVFTACSSVRRIPLPHFKVVVFLVIFSCGTEIVRDFLSLGIKEIAVGMRPTDDVFCVL